MTPDAVREQITELIRRLVAASLSVKQFWPAVRIGARGETLVGSRTGTTVALRDFPYGDVYRELDLNEAYHVKLIDGGLLLLQYTFRADGSLSKHRLGYFPSPALPTIEEAPTLYEQDELYGDILSRQLVRFPLRFDYAPDDTVDVVHPASHLTLGQFENCRIPVSGPVTPNAFGLFIIRNFYHRVYRRAKNTFDRRPPHVGRLDTISEAERLMTHLIPGR